MILVLISFAYGEAQSQDEIRASFDKDPSIENFKLITNPTAGDFEKLSNPSINEFNKLSQDEKSKFFTSTVLNVNKYPKFFESYLTNDLGVQATINGNILGLSSYELTGINQKVNLNDLKNSNIKLEVSSSGEIILYDSSNNPLNFKGTLSKGEPGFVLTLEKGSNYNSNFDLNKNKISLIVSSDSSIIINGETLPFKDIGDSLVTINKKGEILELSTNGYVKVNFGDISILI